MYIFCKSFVIQCRKLCVYDFHFSPFLPPTISFRSVPFHSISIACLVVVRHSDLMFAHSLSLRTKRKPTNRDGWDWVPFFSIKFLLLLFSLYTSVIRFLIYGNGFLNATSSLHNSPKTNKVSSGANDFLKRQIKSVRFLHLKRRN